MSWGFTSSFKILWRGFYFHTWWDHSFSGDGGHSTNDMVGVTSLAESVGGYPLGCASVSKKEKGQPALSKRFDFDLDFNKTHIFQAGSFHINPWVPDPSCPLPAFQ